MNLTTPAAPFVMPSSVRTFMTVSTLSPSLSLRFDLSCLVFLGSLGIWFIIFLLSSKEFAPTTLSCALTLNFLLEDAL